MQDAARSAGECQTSISPQILASGPRVSRRDGKRLSIKLGRVGLGSVIPQRAVALSTLKYRWWPGDQATPQNPWRRTAVGVPWGFPGVHAALSPNLRTSRRETCGTSTLEPKPAMVHLRALAAARDPAARRRSSARADKTHYIHMPICRYADMPICRYAHVPMCPFALYPDPSGLSFSKGVIFPPMKRTPNIS